MSGAAVAWPVQSAAVLYKCKEDSPHERSKSPHQGRALIAAALQNRTNTILKLKGKGAGERGPLEKSSGFLLS